MDEAREKVFEMVGPDGLLRKLTSRVLETALEAELSEHLADVKHDEVGRNLAVASSGCDARR